jgi:hypothetical protein
MFLQLKKVFNEIQHLKKEKQLQEEEVMYALQIA